MEKFKHFNQIILKKEERKGVLKDVGFFVNDIIVHYIL